MKCSSVVLAFLRCFFWLGSLGVEDVSAVAVEVKAVPKLLVAAELVVEPEAAVVVEEVAATVGFALTKISAKDLFFVFFVLVVFGSGFEPTADPVVCIN